MDTIVAQATAKISQAVGIIRLSGPKAYEISSKLVGRLPEKGTFGFRFVFNPKTKEVIDSGLVLVFEAPNSFTGEDVVEFQLHGSPPILGRIEELLISLGAVRAAPGEFSLRAYLNGKSSLPELELANAIVQCGYSKGIAKKLKELRQKLLEILVQVEASISFPVDVSLDENNLIKNIRILKIELRHLLSTSPKLGLLKIVIAGPQNAGKSTLFNYFIGFDRTVVSDVPGTTRDYIEASVKIDDRIVEIIDGPGLEDSLSTDVGQKLVRNLISNSNLILWLDPDCVKPNIIGKVILIQSKSDQAIEKKNGWIQISVKNRTGLDKLEQLILNNLPTIEYAITNRQFEKLTEIESQLDQALKAQTIDLISFELHEVLKTLSELDGVGLSSETLSLIFSTFCIGK